MRRYGYDELHVNERLEASTSVVRMMLTFDSSPFEMEEKASARRQGFVEVHAAPSGATDEMNKSDADTTRISKEKKSWRGLIREYSRSSITTRNHTFSTSIEAAFPLHLIQDTIMII